MYIWKERRLEIVYRNGKTRGPFRQEVGRRAIGEGQFVAA